MILNRQSGLGVVWPWSPEWVWPWEGGFTASATEVLQKRFPVIPPAVLQPPPAPQTEAKMRTWTPADIWEAEAQRQAAANLERQQAGGVAANGAAALSDVPFKVGLGIGTVLLLAGGAVALYLALKR